MIYLWIILGVLLLGIMWIYNSLVTTRNRVDEAWSDIEVQLKRRYDLIPNLVSTVKGYAVHEQTTLEDVTEARAKATSITMDPTKLTAEQMAKFQSAQGELSQALGRLMVVAEQYPDLKANQNFLSLQNDLTDTEDKIQASRRFYNGNVRDYNTKLQVFPTNLLASMFGFVARTFFDIDEKGIEGQAPKVQF
ncbi:MAG: LemA family protein [Candidatus Doudnabacteria bacterium]|nr:LemA family protein [Candidatus Doudnabacteria bacterium]